MFRHCLWTAALALSRLLFWTDQNFAHLAEGTKESMNGPESLFWSHPQSVVSRRITDLFCSTTEFNLRSEMYSIFILTFFCRLDNRTSSRTIRIIWSWKFRHKSNLRERLCPNFLCFGSNQPNFWIETNLAFWYLSNEKKMFDWSLLYNNVKTVWAQFRPFSKPVLVAAGRRRELPEPVASLSQKPHTLCLTHLE